MNQVVDFVRLLRYDDHRSIDAVVDLGSSNEAVRTPSLTLP